MKSFIILTLCLSFVYTINAKELTTRIEGQYSAHYEYSNKALNGNTIETGTVVYLITPCRNGKADIKQELYPASVSGEQNGNSIEKRTAAMDMLNAFWPRPRVCGYTEKDKVTTTPISSKLTRNLAEHLDKNDKKLLNWTGFDAEIKEWKIDDTYSGCDPDCLIVDSLHSIEQTVTMTATGANFRRIFKAPATMCKICITIYIDSVTQLSSKEAKAARKADKARFAASGSN